MTEKLKMIVFPQEVIEKIKFMCETEELGMSTINTNEFVILVIGRNELSPNYIHLAVAQTLITGILSGDWTEANDNVDKRQEGLGERKPS